MSITLKGTPVELLGDMPKVGEKAPDFLLTTANLVDVRLSDYADKLKVLSIVPSLDTPVCGTSAVRFHEEVAQLANVQLLVISRDLPFAATRFCESKSVSGLVTLSAMRSDQFARDYGVLMASGPLSGLTARAVLLLSETNHVIYTELVPEIAQEPNYKALIAAIADHQVA